MSEYSLADFIFGNMESQGFQCVESRGRVGEETLTFQNEAGETRTIQFGFTSVKRKNYRVALSDEELQKTLGTDNKLPDNDIMSGNYTTKVDYSTETNKNPKPIK